MTLNTQGFAKFKLPNTAPSIMQAFKELPFDQYCGGKHRYRRFSQYQLSFSDKWELNLLPHRPFVQSPKYNTMVGGVLREFEPLTIDPSKEVFSGAEMIPLDKSKDWHVNVHQCRIITDEDIPGVSVPEGPHQDGHEYAMLCVFDRHNFKGATTTLLPLDKDEPFFETVIEAGEALVFDDRQMRHFTTNLEPVKGRGHRDMWIVVYNTWDNRKYGTVHEAEASRMDD